MQTGVQGVKGEPGWEKQVESKRCVEVKIGRYGGLTGTNARQRHNTLTLGETRFSVKNNSI